MSGPPIARRRDLLRATVAEWKGSGARVGVVPTMGALHEGHLSLVRRAREECERVIVTIFVNPRQFNNPQDLANYPRSEKEDAAKLAPLGVDALYVPEPEEVYPEGFGTTVSVAGITACMDGIHRPGHFEGVATVVTKLLLQTGADRAYFGEKDYQQLLVVKRLATDLDIPVEIVPCPTVREPDGLAMSSRNLRLSPRARAQAPALFAEMSRIAEGLRAGQPLAPLVESARAALGAAGFAMVEYIELRDAGSLAPLAAAPPGGPPARLFAAAWLEDVRLIDNIPV